MQAAQQGFGPAGMEGVLAGEGVGGGGGANLKGNHGVGWKVISAAGSLIEASRLADGTNQTIGEEDTHAIRVS